MKTCRFCQKALYHEFVDLVNAPPSNAFLKSEDLSSPEAFYPLKLYVCSNCFLVQVDEYKAAQEIFDVNLKLISYTNLGSDFFVSPW